MVGRRDDAKRALRQPPGELGDELEVAPRIRPDGDDVLHGLDGRVGSKVLGVHAECDELDPRTTGAEPCAQLLDLAPAVRDDRVQPPERLGEERCAGLPSKLLQPLGQADRAVDDWGLHASEAPQQRERDPDRVDRGEDDVGAIGLVE